MQINIQNSDDKGFVAAVVTLMVLKKIEKSISHNR